MIVDSSALVALLFREPGYREIVEKLLGVAARGIATPTLLESAIVFSARTRSKDVSPIDNLIRRVGIEVIPFAEEHFREARRAYLRFGKGRHQAALNFGDCISYATARLARLPLLCIGADFAKTDLTLA